MIHYKYNGVYMTECISCCFEYLYHRVTRRR